MMSGVTETPSRKLKHRRSIVPPEMSASPSLSRRRRSTLLAGTFSSAAYLTRELRVYISSFDEAGYEDSIGLQSMSVAELKSELGMKIGHAKKLRILLDAMAETGSASVASAARPRPLSTMMTSAALEAKHIARARGDNAWDVFLSHNQAEGGQQTALLAGELARRGLEPWFDQWYNHPATTSGAKIDVTTGGMLTGVQRSANFVLVLTNSVFTRHFCRLEILAAIEARKPIVCLHETDPRYGKFDFAASSRGPVSFSPIADAILAGVLSRPIRRELVEQQLMIDTLVSRYMDVLPKAVHVAAPTLAAAKRAEEDAAKTKSVPPTPPRPVPRLATLTHRADAERAMAWLDAALQRVADGAADAATLCNPKGHPVLHVAAVCDRADAVKLLVAKGAAVDGEFKSSTALFLASKKGRELAVEALLAAGADVERRHKNGRTPLIAAAEKGKASVVHRLMRAGARSNVALAAGGHTALSIAVQQSRAAAVAELIAGGADVELGRSGVPPLWLAAQKGSADIVQQLIAGGAQVDRPTTGGQSGVGGGSTPLWVAAFGNHERCVELLIHAGAKLDLAREEDGTTALCWASLVGHVEVMEMLIASGADYEKAQLCVESGEELDTPLCSAAYNGHVSACEVLLDAGADVNRPNPSSGGTPLYSAAVQNHAAAVKCLLANGADKSIAACGWTPLLAATENGHSAVVALLSGDG